VRITEVNARFVWRAPIVAFLAAFCLVGGLTTPASAQLYQDRLVSADPANYTPDLIPDQVVAHPRTLALGVSDTTVYVGGQFDTISNNLRTQFTVRPNLFAFDRYKGTILPWAPTVDGLVWSILVDGSSVYIGGDFKTVDGVSRPAIAKLDATTGALDPTFKPPINAGRVTDIKLINGMLFVSGSFGPKLIALNPTTGANTKYFSGITVAGSWINASGSGEIYRFAVDPQVNRLVAVGDFKTVNGREASRVFMLDLTPSSVTLDPWHYEPFEHYCSSASWPAYVQDVDFSPDGTYFAVVSAGYVPPSGTQGYVCDAAARFETDIPDPSQPTWINYTGGDTLRSVAITGASVYVQGHSRWLDNPYGHDSKGWGAVDAYGGGAIDPNTGQAQAWNPPHPCSDGGRVIVATTDGVWWGGDWTYFGDEPRKGIAFTPLS
jgi:hypothetical protein